MKRGFNKKGGIDILGEQVVFIILNTVFAAMLIFAISRALKGGTLTEQNYAKQIALLIDQAKPGTVIELKIDSLIDSADARNFYREKTVSVDNDKKKVTVRVSEGKGYSFDYFSDDVVLWGINTQSKELRIEVVENANA